MYDLEQSILSFINLGLSRKHFCMIRFLVSSGNGEPCANAGSALFRIPNLVPPFACQYSRLQFPRPAFDCSGTSPFSG